MRFLKKSLFMFLALGLIITPLVPSQAYAFGEPSIHVDDSTLGDIETVVLEEDFYPVTGKSLFMVADGLRLPWIDQSKVQAVKALLFNYLNEVNKLTNKNLPFEGDTYVVVVRALQNGTKGQMVPEVVSNNQKNIIYIDDDMFSIAAEEKLTAGTIIHELQHLVNYAYDTTENFSSINEGLSSYFEADFYNRVGASNYTYNEEYQFTNVEANQYDKSLYRVDSYGKSKLFIDYLVETYGSEVIDKLMTHYNRPIETALKEVETATMKSIGYNFEGFVNYIQNRVASQERSNIVENSAPLLNGSVIQYGIANIGPFTFYTKYYKVIEDGTIKYTAAMQNSRVLITAIRNKNLAEFIQLQPTETNRTFKVEAGDVVSVTPVYTTTVADPWTYTPVNYGYSLEFNSNNAPEISLIGNSTMTLNIGDDYTEPGYIASDIEDGNLTSQVIVNGTVDTSIEGSNTIEYTVTDSFGAETRVIRTVIVNSPLNTNPEITIIGNNPQTITQNTPYIELGYSAIDSEEGNLTGDVIINNPVDTSTVGTYTVTYIVSDSMGGFDSKTRTVIVSPDPFTPPTLTVDGNKNITVEVNTSYTSPAVTAVDVFGNNITSTIEKFSNVDINVVGDYIETFTAYNSYDISETETIIVHVVDTTAPILNIIQANIDVSIRDIVDLMYGVTASDNYTSSGNLTWTLTPDVIDTTTPGVFVVTYRVEDSSGNYDERTRLYNVIEEDVDPPILDTTKPVIELSQDSITIEVGEDVTLPEVSITDEDIDSTIDYTGTYDNNTPGVYTLIYTATDSSGNVSEPKTFTITVVDNSTPEEDTTPPVISTDSELTLTHIKGNNFTYPIVTATDDKDSSITAVRTGTVNSSQVGTYTLTYQAEDSAGNKSNIITITVNVIEPTPESDTTKPILTIIGGNAKIITRGTPFTLPSASAIDLVDGDISNKITKTGTFDRNTVGVYPVIYKVTDNAGNETTVTFTLTVTAPQSSGGGGGGGGGSSTITPPPLTITVPEPMQPPILLPSPPPPIMLPPIQGRTLITVGSNIINIEGRTPIIMDAEPFIDNSSRTLLPVRYISDLMNLETEWDNVNRIATFSTEGVKIEVTIGSNIIYVNGEPIEMDTVAIIRNNRTFIPIRYLAEALNVELSWDQISKTIMIFND